MKLPPAPTFDLAADDPAAGCLAGILRRIICGTLRDRTLRSGGAGEEAVKESRPELPKKPPAPGLVARLMGLESMPVFPYASPETVRRSRSTNSVDNWAGFLAEPRNRASPQVRTCQSFREVPTFLRKENEEFLLLSFAPEDGGEDLGGTSKGKAENGRKGSKTVTRIGERRTGKRSERRAEGKENCLGKLDAEAKDLGLPSKKDLERRKPRQRSKEGSSAKPRKPREVPEKPNSTDKKSSSCALGKVELECNSQNSSPVSVLDHHLQLESGNLTGPDSPNSEDDKKPKQSSPRRMLSSDLESPNRQSPKIQLHNSSQERRLVPKDERKSRARKSEGQSQSSSGFWRTVCTITQEEVKGSNWVELWKFDQNGEIGAILGVEILDFLLHEVAADLSSCNNM